MLSLLSSVAGAAHLKSKGHNFIHTLYEGNPVAGLTLLSGSEPWNSKEEGFIWIRATAADLSSTTIDQYLIDMSDGSSSPSAGIRIQESLGDSPSNRYRDDSGNLSSGPLGGNPAIQDTLKTYGFTWSNIEGKVRIISGGLYKENSFTPGTFAAAGFTQLRIGGRNGGNEPFTGTYDAYEIGDKFLSFAALSRRMRHSALLSLAGGGQSLMDDYFSSTETGGSPGFNELVALGSSLYSKEVLAVNGATGSSAVSNLSNGTNYWWHRSTQTPGPAYDTWLSEIQTQDIIPSWCFWSQGEEDCHHVDAGGPTRAQYKADLLAVLTRMRVDVNPNMTIGIQGIGRRNGGYFNTGGVQAIREVQQELANENAWIHMLGYSHDTDLYDQVHLTDAGYTSVAGRVIRRAADLDGQSVTGSTTGPQIVSASRAGTSVTVNLIHDGGSDFTPVSGIVGFRFFDDGVEIAVSAAVRTDATTVTLTLASTPSGVEELYYVYDDASDITNANKANVLKDNSVQAMPLVPAKIVL
ncbi:MAG: hypothetical protein R3E13_08795 [Alphaproteobacteria bacterium]